jgi:PAS domain S-box-containing protein
MAASTESRSPTAALQFLAGGGDCGALMRSMDWSDSPLGPPEFWPYPLRSVVSLLLPSRFPMFVAWGESLGFLYNDAYAEILGAKHPDAMGRPFHEIWAEIWPDISPLIDAAMAGHATYREDLPLVMNRRGYDEQTWFTFSYSPVREESGKVAGMFCAVSETTGRVMAERGLRELNETLEKRVDQALAQRRILADIVEGTDAFVQVADLDYRWLAINRAAADEFTRIFGVRPQVGDNMLELLASNPDQQAAVRAVWSRALAGEEFTEIAEFGDPARDQRFYEMRYNTLRNAEGERIGAYQFVYDVTERLLDQKRLRHAEQALRQAQKMEAIGQLTGGVAHDFNNLLAVFANGLQVLERGVTEEQRKRIRDAMRRAVARGTGLTRHLLAFSRRRPVNAESVDLAAVLTGMRDLLERSLRGDIQVSMEFDEQLWPVEVDTGELELAVLNLCVNARDAMSDSGTVTISASNVHEASRDGREADFVALVVADTGCGMSEEVLARAFEPFFTTKDIGKGTGLGLPQVYGFARQSDGHLSIQSEVGKGTRVRLLLPRSNLAPTAPAETGRAVAATTGSKRRGHILLVEDDKEVAALTREMLAALGFSVTHVDGPAAALEFAAQGSPIDHVLSDVMMPGGMSGVELATRLRERFPDLPIALATGYAESAAALDRDRFKLLLKPYSVEQLAEALGVDLS